MMSIIPPRYAKEVANIVDHQGDLLLGVLLSKTINADDKPSLIKQRVLEILDLGYRFKLDDQWREAAAERKAS